MSNQIKVQLPWLKDNQQIGLGDVIRQVTDYFNIQPGPNCKCEQRRLKLNSWLIFTSPPGD